MLFELKFSGKTSEEKYAASLGTSKICRKHRDSISHIERTVNVLGEDPTEITKTNALFVLLLYVPSQQLWSLRDGQFTKPHFFLGRLEQAVNQ